VIIEYSRGCYNARDFTTEEQIALQASGWNYSALHDCFKTISMRAVIPFVDSCVGTALDKVKPSAENAAKGFIASHAKHSDYVVDTPPSVTLTPVQVAGVEYAMARDNTLIADDMRMGKTYQALAVGRTMQARRVLIICPAPLKTMWEDLVPLWFDGGHTHSTVYGDALIDADVVICNYDIVARHIAYLRKTRWDLIIFDEAHKLRGKSSTRTKLLLGTDARVKKLPPQGKKRIFLTGTVVFNKPIDAYPLCFACDPTGLGADYNQFMFRYCGAYFNEYGGLEPGEGKNLEELQTLMRERFMIRRVADGLAPLPKRTQRIVQGAEGAALIELENRLLHANKDALADLIGSEVDDDLLTLIEDVTQNYDNAPIETPYAEIRQNIGIAKIPAAIEYVEELLTREKKVVVFAYHRAVVLGLEEHFKERCSKIIGGMGAKKAKAAQDRFRTDPTCRVLVANIVAAGEGLNLAVADYGVFVEVRPIPGEMLQAERRVWLPTKETETHAVYLIHDNSLDSHVVSTLNRRERAAKKTTDAE